MIWERRGQFIVWGNYFENVKQCRWNQNKCIGSARQNNNATWSFNISLNLASVVPIVLECHVFLEVCDRFPRIFFFAPAVPVHSGYYVTPCNKAKFKFLQRAFLTILSMNWNYTKAGTKMGSPTCSKYQKLTVYSQPLFSGTLLMVIYKPTTGLEPKLVHPICTPQILIKSDDSSTSAQLRTTRGMPKLWIHCRSEVCRSRKPLLCTYKARKNAAEKMVCPRRINTINSVNFNALIACQRRQL